MYPRPKWRGFTTILIKQQTVDRIVVHHVIAQSPFRAKIEKQIQNHIYIPDGAKTINISAHITLDKQGYLVSALIHSSAPEVKEDINMIIQKSAPFSYTEMDLNDPTNRSLNLTLKYPLRN